MKLRIGLAVLLIAAATLVTASVVERRPTTFTRSKSPAESIAPEPSLVEPVDRCVQKRMHDHLGFGMSRMTGLLHTWSFVPESPVEHDMVASLRTSRMTVGLYLGGRGLLDQQSAGASDLTGPIGLPELKLPADVPKPDDLKAFGRKALAAADGSKSDIVTGSIGRWSIETRAVRADRANCLECHKQDGNAGRDLKIGDPLGVAIYAYTRDQP